MFPGFAIYQKKIAFSSNELKNSESEDDHYEEIEDHLLDDGINLDESIIDEYEDFDEEMEDDIPEIEDPENALNLNFVDPEEAEHYDSLEDE